MHTPTHPMSNRVCIKGQLTCYTYTVHTPTQCQTGCVINILIPCISPTHLVYYFTDSVDIYIQYNTNNNIVLLIFIMQIKAWLRFVVGPCPAAMDLKESCQNHFSMYSWNQCILYSSLYRGIPSICTCSSGDVTSPEPRIAGRGGPIECV